MQRRVFPGIGPVYVAAVLQRHVHCRQVTEPRASVNEALSEMKINMFRQNFWMNFKALFLTLTNS